VDTPAGLVTLAVVGLWGAYLMPHRLRHRQQLVEARIDDRHSGALRVLAVADRPRGRQLPRKRTAPALLTASADCSTPAEPRVRLLTPGRGLPLGTSGGANGGMAVDRPHGTQDRISADKARRTAQHRAAHAAAVARRGAAARRRAALAVVLLVASAAGWAVAGLTAVTVLAGVAPTVLLGSVLVLGRRAVLSGREADAEWERRLRESALPPARATPLAPAVTGRAVRPSDAHTEVFARILDTVDGPAEATAPSAASGTIPVVRRSARTAEADAGSDSGQADAWSPVPVPRPTYTLKAPAPHREPAPLGDVEGSTAAAQPAGVATAPATTLDADGVTRSASTDGERQEGARLPIEQPAATTGSMNLDEILARRRAVGE